MITREILPEVINMINDHLFVEEWQKPNDWMLIELHTFNAGSTVSVESKDYSERTEQYAYENGNIFGDKDDIGRLIEEFRPSLYDEL